MTKAIRLTAAGGVVWRSGRNGIEVLLVHRPGYDDWSFPKGKPDRGENSIQTAAREVTEETGLPFSIGPRLGAVNYEIKGRTKSVSYWSMMLDPGCSDDPSSVDINEVDEFAWLPAERAARVLTYPGDRQILRSFNRFGTVPISLILIRHARAGKRSRWSGPDEDRPLDGKGIRQAAAIGATVPAFAPTRIISAPPARCAQTAAPLATNTGLRVELDDALSDGAWAASPAATVQIIDQLARRAERLVAVSQGKTMTAALNAVLPTNRSSHSTKKGGIWAIGARDGHIVTADYYPTLLADSLS